MISDLAQTMSSELLVASNLCKSQGGVRTLDDVSLTIQRGEIVGLLGLNGAGKSTALNIITGVHQPDSGSITISGVSSTDEPLKCRARLGYLPDRAPLYDDMRVGQYLFYAAQLRGANRRTARAQVQNILTELDLTAHSRQIIAQLSKGYQQRVGLAQALIHDPDLLVLDEPSNGLDPAQANALHEIIRSRSGHRGVLFSSHQLNDVAHLCTHVAVLNRGKLVYSGPVGISMQQTGRQLVTFLTPVSQAALDNLATVSLAESVSPTTWWVTPSQPTASVPQTTNADILRDMLGAGLPVDALTPEKSSLEAVFSSLTGDAAKPAAGDDQQLRASAP